MELLIPKSFWRFFVILYFTIVFGLLLFHGLFLMSTPHAPDTWLVGDWLINYQGGLVRRGLIGEMFIIISRLSGIEIVLLIVIFQLIIYLIYIVNSCRLSLAAPFSPTGFLLICSPAFILFPVLDTQGAFRKEILFLALLSTLCVYLVELNVKVPDTVLWLIGITCVLLIMSHEMLAAYLPYLLCVLIVGGKGLEDKPMKVVTVIIPAMIVAILLMTLGGGNARTVEAICDSLQPNLPLDCIHKDVPGSISQLDDGVFSAYRLVRGSTENNVLLVYAVVTMLSFIPLSLAWTSKQNSLGQINNKKILWLIIFAACAVLASLPLFWVASDYGRLIYIHVSSISLFTLMIIRDTDGRSVRLNHKGLMIWMMSILFVASWRLIHWGASVEKSFPLNTILENLLK